MSSKHIRGDVNFAFPSAEIAVMGPEAAVNIVFRDELAKAADPAAARARYLAEYRAKFANPYAAAALGYVDEVIRPRETRARLCRALAALSATSATRIPPRSTGTSRCESSLQRSLVPFGERVRVRGALVAALLSRSVRERAEAGDEDRERAGRRHAARSARRRTNTCAGVPLRTRRALEGRGRRAAARAAVRSRGRRGARAPGGAVHPARAARRRGRTDRALAAGRADGRGLPGPGAPGRGVRRRRAPRAGDPGAARSRPARAGGRRRRSRSSCTHLELSEAQVVALDLGGGARHRAAAGRRAARHVARPGSARGGRLGDRRASIRRRRRSPAPSSSNRTTSRRASCSPSCRSRPTRSRRRRPAFAARSSARRRRCRSARRLPAGWCCAAMWPRRRSWRIG